MSDAHDIGKDTSGSDGSSCAITANDHGRVVAFGGETKDVVRAFEMIQGMTLWDFLETDLTLSFLPLCHKAPALVFAHETLAFFFKVRIERRKLYPKILERTFKQMVGQEAARFDVAALDTITALTC